MTGFLDKLLERVCVSGAVLTVLGGLLARAC